jgi:hypothetical protein
MHRAQVTILAAIFSATALSSLHALQVKEIKQYIRKGVKQAVWGTMCKDTFCSESICMTFRDELGKPAHVVVSLESTWSSAKNKPSEQVGSYCSPSKWMTYFMTFTVYVQAVDSDVVVSYREAAGQN